MPLVDDAHAPAPSLLFQPILAELLGLDRRLLGFALQAGHDQREDEDRDRAERQQREQREERPPQDRQRAERLGVVDLGDEPHARTSAATAHAPTTGTPR